MGDPMNFFQIGQRAMSAQLVRMNAAASNLANAGSVAGSENEAYRALRPVFAEKLGELPGVSSVSVDAILRSEEAPTQRHDPTHPLADEDGNVWIAAVDEQAEMVEMLEASRQYRNMVEALSTAKQLTLETMRLK